MNSKRYLLIILFAGFSFLAYADSSEENSSGSELHVAGIAAVSAIVVSIITARITSRYTLRSKPLDAYSSSIQKKRLEKYECLYTWLSDLGKLIFRNNEGEISEQELKTGLQHIQEKVEEYDSEVSLYYSAKTGYISYLFRDKLKTIVNHKDFNEYFKNRTALEKFRKDLAARFETSLKLDIGIYEMDIYNRKKSFSYFIYNRKAKKDVTKEMRKE